MPRKSAPIAPTPLMIESRIFTMRGQRVMLDSELAELYGVTTKRLNEQVQRNVARFPNDFAFQLTAEEYGDLKAQNASSGRNYGGRRYRPWAFTELGVAMLSSVLTSEIAVQVNIGIMRAFVRIRRLLATPGELVAQLQALTETVQLHDEQIKAISAVLQKMLETPPPAPKKPIGFHTLHPPAEKATP